MVRVKGRILEDGTRVAHEIERLDEEETVLRIVFVGEVDSIDPWVVSGIPLQVDDETVIIGDIEIGQTVTFRVDAHRDHVFTGRVSQIRLNAGMSHNVVTYDVVIEIDGKPLTPEEAGADIEYDDGRSILTVTGPRLYRIVEQPEWSVRDLRLASTSDNFAVFAFTFGIYDEGA